MMLPMDVLVQYAENFYRRFPDEFLALGMPGLEEAFDLRPHGSWSRRVDETPSEKTVEITIRRWPNGHHGHLVGYPGAHTSMAMHPGFAHHHLLHHPHSLNRFAPPQHPAYPCYHNPMQMQGPASAPCIGGCPLGPCGAQGQATAGCGCACGCGAPGVAGSPAALPADFAMQAAAAVAMVEEQAGGRLTRLEGALNSLKQQIEALLAAQMANATAAAAAAGAAAAAAATGSSAALLRSQLPEQPPQRAAQGAPPQQAASVFQQHRPPPLVPLNQPAQQPAQQVQPMQQAPAPQPIQQAPAAQPLVAPQQPQSAAQDGGGGANTDGDDTHMKAATKDQEEDNELRVRRHMIPLQITTTPSIDKANFKTASAPPPVIKLNEGESEDAADPQKATERERPRVSVSTVRVAPSAHDPASPRSPGRYSVWKS